MRYGNLHISRIKIDIETDELIPYEFMELSREEWDTVIEELDEDLFIKVRTIFHLKFGTNIEKKILDKSKVWIFSSLSGVKLAWERVAMAEWILRIFYYHIVNPANLRSVECLW